MFKASHRGHFIAIEIEDSGIGIPEEYHSLAFEEWPQIVGLYEQKRGTFGFSLPLCKAMIELHGGTIWLENTQHQSTKYCFTLPIAQADNGR